MTTKMPEIKLELPKFNLGNLENLKNKGIFYWLGLIPLFILALYIRTRNLPILQGKYLIELDSYFFFRYSKLLLEQGSLPATDFMRYVPEGASTASNVFFPQTLVFFYKVAHAIFPNLSQIEWHIIYPPVITIVSFVFFFLFVRELLNSNRIAFLATAFIAVIPAYMQRTGAGFADHEAVAMLWLFISLWLFVLAWKSDSWKKFMPLAAVSGIFAGALAASWGGYILFISSIVLFVLAYTILTDKSKAPLLKLLPFGVAYFFSGAYFWAQPLTSFAKQIPNILLFVTLMFLFVHTFLQKLPKVRELKIPYPITSLLVTAAIALPANFILGLADLGGFVTALTKEGAARHFFTVSENAQPYFLGGWWDSFGWIFLLGFLGSILFFYKIFQPEEISRYKLHFYAAGAYIVFFLAFIFGRLAPGGGAGVQFLSSTYLYWIAGFLILLGIIYFVAYYKDQAHLKNISDKWPWLFLAITLLIVFLAARGQIRLLFATVPIIAISAGIFVSEIIDWVKQKSSLVKYFALAAILVFALLSFGIAANTSMIQNRYSGSIVTGQWGDSMDWIRNNTEEDSVFAHWWDYGYMTIVVGERAAVTDGGNQKGWNHQSGRYFLTGKDDTSTLTYLKTHNVTHILISEEEIPKYHAFSFIGSDETLDRQSTIGVFKSEQSREVRNGTAVIYTGGWVLDKDYVLDKLVLPKDGAFVGGFTIMADDSGILTEAPIAHVIHNGQQIDLRVSCVIVQQSKARMEFETNENETLNGCIVFIPSYIDQTQANPVGGILWLSEKVYDTNLARWYIYGEEPSYLKKVYDDGTPLAIYRGSLIGPIKIWELNYPGNITADPFYLQSSPYG